MEWKACQLLSSDNIFTDSTALFFEPDFGITIKQLFCNIFKVQYITKFHEIAWLTFYPVIKKAARFG